MADRERKDGPTLLPKSALRLIAVPPAVRVPESEEEADEAQWVPVAGGPR